MVYLGIKLVPGLEKIIQIQPVYQDIQNWLQNWSKLTSSILRQINRGEMINTSFWVQL